MKPLDQEGKGCLIAWIIVVGLLASLTFHYYSGQMLHQAWPHNTFLFQPRDAWNDFINIFRALKNGGPYSSVLAVYFPFTYVLLYPAVHLNSISAFLLYAAVFLATTWAFVWSELEGFVTPSRRLITSVLAWASYPVLFCVDRGNLEMLVFVALTGFVIFYRRGKTPGAVVCLAAATAMKGYPAVFGLLFLIDRRYKAVLWTALLSIVMTIVPAALFQGGLLTSAARLAQNLQIFARQISVGEVGLQYACGYFGAIMVLGFRYSNGSRAEVYQAFGRFYVWVSLVVFAGVVVYLLRIEKVFWKKVALLTFVILLLPQVSYDYKMIHLLIPVAAFIAEPIKDPRDRFYAWGFGLLLIPKSYYFFFGAASIATLINPLLMTVMAICILSDGLERRDAKRTTLAADRRTQTECEPSTL